MITLTFIIIFFQFLIIFFGKRVDLKSNSPADFLKSLNLYRIEV